MSPFCEWQKLEKSDKQIFQICEIKNNISAEYAQSETEGILNHLLEETRKYMNHLGDYDVIVIGAGHAGIEAAHAAATLGARTAVFTMSLDAIGNMPCNPSIGGTAKGTLVRELDALGGVMGLAADATYLQSRMLNKGKGPAVHALRVQTDRKRYHEYMKHALELTPGLAIHQAEVVSIETENGRVKGVVTQLNGEYSAKCVVIATGTNLGGKIFVGDAWYASGPDGMHAANALTDSLKAAGLPLRRFKTGTPARVHRRSIDFSKLECQPGDPDNELQPFSFMTDAPMHNKVECWIAYTNPETHRIILDNIQRSPLYGGMIEGVGPRYCPSIEDKVVRFAGKDRHPIFVEPCGENTEEMYLQGASSSLPEDVQNAFYRSIKGFENIEIMRPAYAIEYDCVDPTSLEATLESKVVRGLYGAGQFNGTSGYEEAAAQGLLAGLNAARNALGKEQLILPRHTSYLGTLVDDLVTKGVMDPYRMMTSRSEYRLTLRQDNADQRLTPIGREYGLVQDDRWAKYQHTQSILEAERRRLHETHLRTADLRTAMEAAGLAPAAEGGIAEELLRRPEISYPLLAGVIGWGEQITPMLAERLETEIKYAGYIARQDRMIRDVARHEKTLIPDDFEYSDLTGLTLEAREKLARIRPKNLGQAGRIPGVSPSDVAQLSSLLPAQRVFVWGGLHAFCKMHRRRGCSLLRAKREPEKHPLLSRRGRHGGAGGTNSRATRPNNPKEDGPYKNPSRFAEDFLCSADFESLARREDKLNEGVSGSRCRLPLRPSV